MMRNYLWFLGTAFVVPLLFLGLISVIHEPTATAVLVLAVSTALYVGTDSGESGFQFSRLNPLDILWRWMVLVGTAAYLAFIIFIFLGKFPCVQTMLVISALTSAIGLDWKIKRNEIFHMGTAMILQIIIVLIVLRAAS